MVRVHVCVVAIAAFLIAHLCNMKTCDACFATIPGEDLTVRILKLHPDHLQFNST
jgi:hypothetical protein